MKNYFSLEDCTDISSLKPGAHIHFIGVSGIAMAPLAATLSDQGFNVSGSDKEFYDPAGSILKGSQVTTVKGYKAEHITDQIDLVLIGNAVPATNPEVLEVEKQKKAYTCFPKAVADLVISERHSLVACGTHGKSTTSALAAHVAQTLELEPSFFIGAQPRSLSTPLHIGSGSISVVEGDEYDTAFFAKIPKFFLYAPDTAIITSLEFDHADIYSSLDDIIEKFDHLLTDMDSGSTVISYADSTVVQELIAKHSHLNHQTYGQSDLAMHRLKDFRKAQGGNLLTIESTYGDITTTIPVYGLHNSLNSLAVAIALASYGEDWSSVWSALGSFQAPKRRQEVIIDSSSLTIIDDFAHHPTAVGLTIQAVKQQYPGRKVWAVFEPRSNTSRRKIFENDYIEALSKADSVLLQRPVVRELDDQSQMFSSDFVVETLSSKHGRQAVSLDSSDQIVSHLQRNIEQGDVVLVMSNGSFGGLIAKLKLLFK